ncbi:MAG: RDD family protein [Actinomycetota bacterium]|nr:RDD family protein [Actinomycetota bacterium]
MQRHGPGAEIRSPGSSDVEAPTASTQVPEPPASFGVRAISFLVDYVAPVIVLNLVLSIVVTTGSPALSLVFTVVGCLALVVFAVWNSGYLQGTTGRSLGRRVARTKLVNAETGQPVGFGWAVLRQTCHLLGFGIGYLWPLWDSKRRTVADKIVGTVVVRVEAATEDHSATDHRRLAG